MHSDTYKNLTKLFFLNLKQSWLPAFGKKDPKIHKRWKERFLIRWNRTERAYFRGSPLFQATYKINNINNRKQTINSTYLVSVGCGRLAEGKGHETDWRDKIKTDKIIFFVECTRLYSCAPLMRQEALHSHPCVFRVSKNSSWWQTVPIQQQMGLS